MDTRQRQRAHTIAESVQGRNIQFTRPLDVVPEESNTKNRTSLPPGSILPPVTTSTGKSWSKLFGGQHTKQTSLISSPNSPELDLSYITPKLIVMTTPRENISDISSHSTAELIYNILNTKHPDSYMIYTLDQSSNDQLFFGKELFHNRVHDLPSFDEQQSPRLVVLLWFCQKITSYLLESPSNVIVIHGLDERNQIAFGVCSLLAYHQIFPRVDQIIQYYQSKRCTNISFTMSQKRYIQYLCDLSFDAIERPRFNELILKAIHLSPVPLVNRQKTSCRPFVDIYGQDHSKVFSTYQETGKLKVYSASDSECVIPVNLPFNGDITIHITHATISHSRQTHEGGIRICELTINSNFSTSNHPELSYSRNELDGIDPNEKTPTSFRVTIEITNPEKTVLDEEDLFTELVDQTLKQPLALFGDINELQRTINDYEKQSKQENPDINEKTERSSSLSSVIHRRRKSKDETTSTSPLSPQSNTNRISSRFSFPSSSSFINPWHATFKQKLGTNQQTTVIEENLNKDKSNVETLLDLGDGNSTNDVKFERSFSSDKQQEDFNSSRDSQPNLLDDFHFDKPILPNNATPIIFPEPIKVTTIPKTEEKPSIATKQSRTLSTTNTANYNVNIGTNHVPTTRTQSGPPLPNSPTSPSQKSKIDLSQFLSDIEVLNKDFKPQPGPSVLNTIGAARKASVSKDIDPTVLKVREWTEGKTRNLRALLCSLSNITWPECQWPGCQMNELVTDEQVKKAYRKAVLHIHPDKLRGDPNEPLAKLIFVELNEAWSQFEKELN